MKIGILAKKYSMYIVLDPFQKKPGQKGRAPPIRQIPIPLLCFFIWFIFFLCCCFFVATFTLLVPF
jgi:hypothetical protein